MRLALAVLLLASPVRAERQLLTRETQEVRAGERLVVELETPYGLTPPPGIQNERALRGFAASLCTARCVTLPAENVRPRDGWSMVYRVEFVLPRELAAGRYELHVRFPGGGDQLANGVIVHAAAPLSNTAHVHASGCSVAFSHGDGAPLGLLLLALSRRLAAGRGWARMRARLARLRARE